jgi:hypothetical protein
MRQEDVDVPNAEDGGQQTARLRTPAGGSSAAALSGEAACRRLGVAVLAVRCLEEIDTARRGKPCDETYGLELFRRATTQGDHEAWAWLQRCFGGIVLAWLRRHPSRAAACRLESEATYVALAFDRFWQATAVTQQVTFSRLSAALQYLRASLHGAILETLRANARQQEVPRPSPGEAGEPLAEEQAESSEVWEALQVMLPTGREQRLAYLLYQCGLGPREIVRFCPQEWSDLQEIYHLRRTILDRLTRTTDQLCWR